LDDVFAELGINEKCIIKMDVQGAELSVMKGASKILEDDCVIITEYWPWGHYLNEKNPSDFVSYMKSKGYSFFNLRGKRLKDEYIKRMNKVGKIKKYVQDDFLIKKD